MSEGAHRRNTSTGARKRNPSTGGRKRATSSTTGCCCCTCSAAATVISGCTGPSAAQRFNVAFSGITVPTGICVARAGVFEGSGSYRKICGPGTAGVDVTECIGMTLPPDDRWGHRSGTHPTVASGGTGNAAACAALTCAAPADVTLTAVLYKTPNKRALTIFGGSDNLMIFSSAVTMTDPSECCEDWSFTNDLVLADVGTYYPHPTIGDNMAVAGYDGVAVAVACGCA